MTKRNQRGNNLTTVNPESLTRDELIALVRSLQAELAGAGQPDPVPAQVRLPGAVTLPSGPDYTIVFDGGSLGNPGLGYGSYEVRGREIGRLTAHELEFGRNMTNNQAEFHALIAALEQLLVIAGDTAATSSLAVRGDSQLVINGLSGKWRIKNQGLQPLYRQASDLLRRFGSVDLAWHPRAESVRTFGH